MQIEASIWQMDAERFKVYSDDVAMIRQLANAEGCKVSATYTNQAGRLIGLDAILPYGAKYGRRIYRVLRSAGFTPKGTRPNLRRGEVLTLCKAVPSKEAENAS